MRSAAILVLGDIGRSPRMMYHAQSFAENDFTTDIIGYGGSKPIPSLERLPKVRIRHIPELPKILHRLPFLLLAPLKVMHQVINILLCLLVWIEIPPEFIVVQNPPSIPTLALVQLVGRMRGSKIIIDWHNLGYTILAMRLGSTHKLVKIAKWFEATFGYSAYAHLFVTRAMRDHLVEEWDLQGHKIVLYDRPPQSFHRSSVQETHELFQKLHPALSLNNDLQNFLPDASPPYSTYMTQTSTRLTSPTGFPITQTVTTYTNVEMPKLRPDRPAIVVSSTSWTPDEDFGILLDALKIYNARAEEIFKAKTTKPKLQLPKLLVILTGKGPLRDKYMKEVGVLQKSWKWVRCISIWLEAKDYPILLGAADLGVCLHSSSSALDLPMKVVDMFGCGLPVCALDFACLNELVKNGKNGLIFKTSLELASQFERLFTSFPNAPQLALLASSLANLSGSPSTPTNPHIPKPHSKLDHDADSWHWSTWEENWGRKMRPLILSDVNL
ncbi:UDP-glycosyltransferase TURAN [Psilocybe cubensis]|uniref:UDP-glycosyltransferase TURAN n=2 Tax=Psilocybe cubensis TaxID=181762 RepID=A0ACB8HHQ4_PSICU|nr:UDP-glycosyltransferase TURAN [Psilocybe cubensis]KAH9486709.1 UDP-glycosyltransferase TURAN [Psilocybe cubensis]